MLFQNDAMKNLGLSVLLAAALFAVLVDGIGRVGGRGGGGGRGGRGGSGGAYGGGERRIKEVEWWKGFLIVFIPVITVIISFIIIWLVKKKILKCCSCWLQYCCWDEEEEEREAGGNVIIPRLCAQTQCAPNRHVCLGILYSQSNI